MRIYFYSPKAVETLEKVKSYEDLFLQSKGLEFWIHSTFFHLKTKQTLFEPILTDNIPEMGIIVFHKSFFTKDLKPNKNQFFICVQADYGRHKFAQMHIVQNPFQINNFRASKKSVIDNLFNYASTNFISHWPQPGLLLRDLERGYIIENISFFGNKEQIPIELVEYLNSRSINFKAHFDPSTWNNYEQTDIVLAIRSFDQKPHYNKPFSKIVNANLAGCLVIAGAESSAKFYKYNYYPELPIATTIDELIKAIDLIIGNPKDSFDRLRKSQSKIEKFTEDGVLLQWLSILEFAVTKFEDYKKSSNFSKEIFFKYRSF
jgi:hypothetical protein